MNLRVFKGDRVLIAGGGGFLGKNVAARLVSEGFKVTVFDNWVCSYEGEAKAFLEPLGVEVCTCDILNKEALRGLFRKYPDTKVVINFAGIPTPKNYLERPRYAFEVNVRGTENLIDVSYLEFDGNLIFIQASSSEIYGTLCGENTAVLEEDTNLSKVDTTGPRACYAESKRAAETICKLCAEPFKDRINLWILRLFNIYGPEMAVDDGRVIPEFICNSLQGKESIINGNRHRSFMYVKDFCDVIARILNGQYGSFCFANSNTLIVNVGGQAESTGIVTLHKIIADQLYYAMHVVDSKPVAINIPTNTTDDDPADRVPSLVKFNSIFGGIHETDLYGGLQETIKYFLKKLREPLED